MTAALEAGETPMTRLTELQRVALNAAAAHPSGVLPAEAIKQNEIPKRALTSLVKRGLLREEPTDEEELRFRTEGENSLSLQITDEGRAAIKPGDSAEARSADGVVPSRKRQTKQDTVLKLLKRKSGASLSEIMEQTGWQQHSVRGFLSGTVKKKLGFEVVSERCEKRGRIYRVSEAGA